MAKRLRELEIEVQRLRADVQRAGRPSVQDPRPRLAGGSMVTMIVRLVKLMFHMAEEYMVPGRINEFL